jgi:hypothetical protein
LSKKLSYDFVRGIFLDHGLELLETIYKNNRTPMLCKNKDGYYGNISLHHVQENKYFLPFSSQNTLSLKNLQIFFDRNAIHSEILFDNYKDCKEKCKFRCECGKIFYKDLDHIISRKTCKCKECSFKNIGNYNSHSYDFVKTELNNHEFKMLQDYYINCKTYIEVEDARGFRGFITLNAVRRNQDFLKFDTRINEKYYIYNINKLAEQEKLDSVAIGIFGKERGKNTSIIFKCTCGNVFFTTKRKFFAGTYCKCKECSDDISSYEKKVMNWLNKYSINYIFQKSFDDCRNKNPLPFDFFIYDKNILIEVDGEGHYHPVNFGGCSDSEALLLFEYMKDNDRIKTEYCLKNNIKLIRIPYYDIKTNIRYTKILIDNLLG